MLLTGTRGDMQLVSGATVLDDGATASGSADRRKQQINCNVQNSASEFGERRERRLQNEVLDGRKAAATCSGDEVKENSSTFVSLLTRSDRGTPWSRNTLKIAEYVFLKWLKIS